MADNIVVTKSQIQDVIKSENMKPSDLFGTEQILADPIVKGYAEDRVRERIGSEYQHRKSAEEELEKLKKKHEDETKAVKDENEKLKKEAAKTKTGTLLDKEVEKRSLDDRQKKFFQKRLDRFDPQKIENMEKEFSEWMDKGLDEFKDLAEVYDYKIEDKSNGDKDKKKTGAEPADKTGATIDNPYLDPAKNPLIKTD